MTDIKILEFQKKQLRTGLPELKAGMKVKVWYKIKEGEKTRTTFFEGIIIATKHGAKNTNGSFTVRKIAVGNIGAEITWPLHSPVIEKIEIINTVKTRRNKLYYLRERSRKQVKAKLKKKKIFKELEVVAEAVEPEETPEESEQTEATQETQKE